MLKLQAKPCQSIALVRIYLHRFANIGLVGHMVKKRRFLCSELFTRYLFLFALYVVQFKNSRLSVILPPLYTRVRTLIDLLSDAHALSERSPRMRHMFYINLFKPQAEFHLKPYSLQTLIEPQATVEEFPKILYFQPLEKEF